jgi:hypothetical protein
MTDVALLKDGGFVLVKERIVLISLMKTDFCHNSIGIPIVN